MTSEEVIKEVIATIEGAKGFFVNTSDIGNFDIAIDALEKQLSKKPNYPYADKTAYCPNCTMIVDDLYCGTCGQKLDWGY